MRNVSTEHGKQGKPYQILARGMAYIPLDQEAKVKGKAAIDVVGMRLGKAGGSLLQQALIAVFGSLGAATEAIAVLLFATIGCWIWAVVGLGRAFRARLKLTPDEGRP